MKPRHTSSDLAPPSSSGGGLTSTFLRIQGRLRRLASHLLGNEQEADDALYEAFARLWTRREQLHSTAEEEAMLTTTVRHLSIDTLRFRRSHQEMELCPELSYQEAENDSTDVEQQYQALQRLMAQHLTPLQQQLLQLREVEGESYTSLSTTFGMQEAALRQQISRARKTLRQLYLQHHPSP